MKDMLGVEVEVGDVIVSASGQGNHKVGKVYAFSGKGLPMIECFDRKWDHAQGKYAKGWMKVSAGYSVLIIGRERLGQYEPTRETWEAICREYPSDSSQLG